MSTTDSLNIEGIYSGACTVPLELKSQRKAPSFTLIIPVYNEVDIVAKNLKVLNNFLESEEYELIVCDDHSLDGTYHELKGFVERSKNPNILLMRQASRIGKGGTIRRAVQEATGEIVVFMDVDLSADLRSIPKLIREARNSAGIVVGRRDTADRCAQGGLRVVLSSGYNILVRLFFRTGVRDHQCGLKAMKADVARQLMAKTRNNGFVFDTELIILARELRIPVHEIHVDWVDNRPRKSNLKWIRNGVTMMKDLIMIKINDRTKVY